MFRGRLSPHRALILAGQLAEEQGTALWAALMARSHPNPAAAPPPLSWRGWTTDRQTLTHIGDLLASANWQRGGGQGRKPEPLPRPKSTAKPQTLRERMQSAASNSGG